MERAPIHTDALTEADTDTRSSELSIAGTIMMAEYALTHDQPTLALAGYLDASERSENPDVAQRALFLARQFGDITEQRRALARWSTLAPDDVSVLEATLISEVEQDNLAGFESALRHLLTQHPDYPSHWMASLWGNAEPAQQPALANSLTRAAAAHNNDSLAIVVTEIKNREAEGQGTDWLDAWLETHAITPEILLYRAQLMLPDRSAALGYLESSDSSLKTAAVLSQMARWHGLQGNREQAITLIEAAVSKDSHRGQDQLTWALLLMQAERLAEAEPVLKSLLGREEFRADAYYHLGEIAKAQGMTALAIDRFLRVEQSELIIDARRQLALLALEQQDPDQANRWFAEARLLFPSFAQDLLIAEAQFSLVHDAPEQAVVLATEALTNDPNDRQLLYIRALANEQLDRITDTEVDLRRILDANPEDADALNALGYTLADRTDRHQEAYALIRQALDRAPEAPHILDSMGWVLYKLGRLNEAVPYLEKAWSLMPDHEIAAHLGEVLWALGRTEEAAKIWQAGYELTPESDIITATMNRLKNS